MSSEIVEKSNTPPHIHTGNRLIYLETETYITRCEECGKKVEYNFPPLYTEDRGNIMMCEKHKTLVVQDFLGIHCIHCELEASQET